LSALGAFVAHTTKKRKIIMPTIESTRLAVVHQVAVSLGCNFEFNLRSLCAERRTEAVVKLSPRTGLSIVLPNEDYMFNLPVLQLAVAQAIQVKYATFDYSSPYWFRVFLTQQRIAVDEEVFRKWQSSWWKRPPQGQEIAIAYIKEASNGFHLFMRMAQMMGLHK
jgi:hypothetical protein